MDIGVEIKTGFNLSADNGIADDYIRDNPDLMWIKEEINTLVYVPCYMLWCVNNKEENGNLIVDYTLNALAEYGRAKDKDNNYLNFKFLCNASQKSVVLKFLSWCANNLEFIDDIQLQRSIKNWAESS